MPLARETIDKKERSGLIRRFLSRLSFPKLFLLVSGLFLLDAFIPDPIPFMDEVLLGGLAVMLGMWRDRREEKEARSAGKKLGA